jgi:spermidine/putrescine transport system permease protein
MSVTTAPPEPAQAHPQSTGAITKGFTPPAWMRKAGSQALNVWAGIVLLYLFAPIFVIIGFSFNKPKGRFNYLWQRFTLDNWAHPFRYSDLVHAMGYSLRIALIASIIATAMGALMAIALARYRFKGGGLVNLLIVLPLTTPEIVLGSSLLTLFISANTARGFTTILIAHIMFCVSFVALTVKARLRGFDWTLEDAAMDLGAPPWRTFRKVTLPLITPGILAAFLLSFALSIDDYIITVFVAGNSVTFPIQVINQSKVSVPPQINVLATMVLLVSVTVMGVGSLLGVRRARVQGTP